MTVSADARRVYERFHLLVNAPALFNAIVTACELGLFQLLANHPDSTFADIHKSIPIPAHQLRVLLHAVCTTGLITKEGIHYSNSAAAGQLLAPDSPASWRHILVGWKEIYYPAFAHMTSAMRSGTNAALASYPGTGRTLYERLAGDARMEKILHDSMRAFTLQSMSGLLENIEIAPGCHLLDVGGGDGTTAICLAERYPDLRITIFDLASVTRIAADAIGQKYGHRIRLQPGDMFADNLPDDIDAVLFSHVLEVFSAENIIKLLRKALDALPSGGKLFCYGFNVSDDETRGIYSARLSLYLNVLATGEGMAYPAKDYEEWMRQIGCSDVKTITDLPFEHGLTIGTKPGSRGGSHQTAPPHGQKFHD